MHGDLIVHRPRPLEHSRNDVGALDLRVALAIQRQSWLIGHERARMLSATEIRALTLALVHEQNCSSRVGGRGDGIKRFDRPTSGGSSLGRRPSCGYAPTILRNR